MKNNFNKCSACFKSIPTTIFWLCLSTLVTQSANASTASQFFKKFSSDRNSLQIECIEKTPSNIRPGDTASTPNSYPILRAVRAEVKTNLANSLLEEAFNIKAFRWFIDQYPIYFQCGEPIDLQQVQDGITQFNQLVAEEASLPDTPGDNVSKKLKKIFAANKRQRLILAMYDLEPSIGENGVLALNVVLKKIQKIRVASQCPNQKDEHIITYLQDTLPIRGQKPDSLVVQELGFRPGDRLPESSVQEKAFYRVMNLNLFRLGSVVISLADNDPNQLNYIFCLNQLNEAELSYLEARRIGTTDATSALKSIAEYKRILSLLQQPKLTVDQLSKAARRDTRQRIVLNDIHLANYRSISVSEVDVLEDIASAHNALGNYYEALRYYNQAISLIQSEKVTDSEREKRFERKALMLTAIADIYSDLGDRQQAQRYYNEVLSLRLARLIKVEQQGEMGR